MKRPSGTLHILEKMEVGKKIKIAIFPPRNYWSKSDGPCLSRGRRKVCHDRDKGNYITYGGIRVYEDECPWGTKDIP